jgi:uncharacterized membrane-anchored protein YjiN (DUF445 family)
VRYSGALRHTLTCVIDLMTVGDTARRGSLRRMRAVATGLLVLAAVVFVLTLGRDGVWGYVHAAAEAGMVGAIADWFAVTALFRHPLGLPVPHTAIIPRRKDSLARSLEQFVSENFLTAATVRERYAGAEVARRVGTWLSRQENADRLVAEASPFAGRLLERIAPEDMQAFVEQTLVPRMREEPLSPLAGHLLEAVVEDRAHRGVIDIATRELHSWLETHPDEVRAILYSRAPWWSPQWLDEKVVDRVYAELVAWAAEVQADPEHRVILALDSYLAELARDLQHDETTMARAEALKERILEHPGVGPTAVALWEAIRVVLVEALEDPAGHLRVRLAGELRDFGARLASEPELAARLDEWGADATAALVERYGAELTTVISSTIERWDGREAAGKIELHVGRDLQFIRINGTVVGALVGLVLHTVSQLG